MSCEGARAICAAGLQVVLSLRVIFLFRGRKSRHLNKKRRTIPKILRGSTFLGRFADLNRQLFKKSQVGTAAEVGQGEGICAIWHTGHLYRAHNLSSGACRGISPPPPDLRFLDKLGMTHPNVS